MAMSGQFQALAALLPRRVSPGRLDGSQSQCGAFADRIHFMPLPRIESQFLRRLCRSLHYAG